MKFFAWLVFLFSSVGIYFGYKNHGGDFNPIIYLMFFCSFVFLFGNVIKDLIIQILKSWWSSKKEHKAWKTNLERQAIEIETLGKAKNKVNIEALELETKALIARIKAGEQVQSQLVSKFNELTSIGDNSYEYLKKEIQNMPAMKNVNFNL
jgi:hypothetical protein